MQETEEKALVYARQRYDLIKNTLEVYEFAQMYMEVNHISEENHIKQMAEEYRKEKGRENLYEQITKGFSKETEKGQAFDSAVDKWVKQADIQIVSGD